MTFKYEWHRQEANFGPVIDREVSRGTHLTIESVPMFEGKFVALRRPKAVPHHEIPPRALAAGRPMLYFIHDLPIWDESLTGYADRIVAEQAGVEAKRIQVIDFTMNTYKDEPSQWALTVFLVVELNRLPVAGVYGNEVTEAVTFTKDTCPADFGWYEPDEIRGLVAHVSSLN